jgi:hypothetical protein
MDEDIFMPKKKVPERSCSLVRIKCVNNFGVVIVVFMLILEAALLVQLKLLFAKTSRTTLKKSNFGVCVEKCTINSTNFIVLF